VISVSRLAAGAARLVATAVRRRLAIANPPRMLTFTVTMACNARCVMCDSWRMMSRDDLTLAEIEDIFAQLPALDLVRLTGGEPFLRRDLTEIADAAVARLHPAVLHVTTNGFLTERIVSFCERRDRLVPLYLLVSLDGLEPKHNEVRGKPDAWRRTAATLAALAPRQRELGLRLAVNQTVVDGDGVEQYRALRSFLAPLAVRHQVVVAYAASATYNLERGVDVAPRRAGEFHTFGEIRPDQVRDLVDEAWHDASRLPLPERLARRYYLAGVAARLVDGDAYPNPPCVALDAHLRILPNGDVPTCQFNGAVVGNLRHRRFAEVWAGAAASEKRAWVRACPGCWAECEVAPSAAYSGDLARALLPTFGQRRRSPVAAPAASDDVCREPAG
jgi:MoaA/NifB/PqqE/SkfB family radical SAM enzyme